MSEFASLVANLHRAVMCNDPVHSTNNGSRLAHEAAVELRRRLVGVVARNTGITTEGVGEILGVTKTTAYNHLTKCIKLGLVRRRTGRFSGWEVV